jgi:endoglycosylceramidase
MTGRKKICLFSAALVVMLLETGSTKIAAAEKPACSPTLATLRLKSEGGFIKDSYGRVVLLRGANVPMQSYADEHFTDRDLQTLASFGFNFIRLGISWDKAEPKEGQYNRQYLDAIRDFAARAGKYGIYVMPEVHKFGWCQPGSDMPAWMCKDAPKHGLNSYGMLLAAKSFWRTPALQDKLIDFWLVLVNEFQGLDNVMGYNCLNEPIDSSMLFPGAFDKMLFPFYGRWIEAIRKADPSVMAVLEPSTINMLIPMVPPKFPYQNIVYAPHPYFIHTYSGGKLIIVQHESMSGLTKKYARIDREAKKLNAPLLIGEYGGPPEIDFASNWLVKSLELQDKYFASASIWAYDRFDTGWDIVDSKGKPKPFFWKELRRPYPRFTAGRPGELLYSPDTGSFSYAYSPDLGIKAPTEIFLSRELAKRSVNVQGAEWSYNDTRQVMCLTANPGSEQVKVTVK